MFERLRQKLSGAKGAKDQAYQTSKRADDLLHVPDAVSNEELIAVQQLLALQAKLDQEILFESHCSAFGKSHYIVVSKCSVRLYKSKKHWNNSKKKASPEMSLMIHDSYAVVPEVPVKNTMQIRTTSSIVAIKLQDEDAVDNCIALINNQSVNQTNREARFHFWKGKYTVHILVTEIWDLPILDSGSAADPFVQVRIISKSSGQSTLRPKHRSNDGDDIVFSVRVRDRERNPVFNDPFTFLCVNGDDDVVIDLFDFDQWGKKEVIGFVRIDLSQYWDRGGMHGWFPILDTFGDIRPGNGYIHIKLAIFDAVDSIDHISLTGSNFISSRLLRLQGLRDNLEPISPGSQKIPIFVGTWNVGNEPPPDDISAWIVKHHQNNLPNSSPKLQRADSMASETGFQLAKRDSMEKNSDSVDDHDVSEPSSGRRLLKSDSAEFTSLDNDDELGSLNDLKIRSRKPRNGVKAHPVGRTKYERAPLEIPTPPGLYVIGCQECQYTPKNGSNCKDDWIATLSQHLGSEYVLVDYSSLWQIRMAIFARKDLFPHISNVSVHKEATGIAHVLGNKGGVVCSFRLFQTWMCFVNCHLAAHQTKRDQRNQDIRDIIIKSGSKVGNKQNDLACQFHYVWLLGDLNYRLDYGAQANQKSPSLQEFREMECLAQAGRFSALFSFDQLNRDMQKKEILSEWVEGVYNFPPSFKLERHAGFEYNSARSPAWCDRILWKSFSSEDLIEQCSMRICESVATSDHKPIASLFEVAVFHFDESRNFNRGRAELLFTEVSMRLTDQTVNANPVQFHLRFRSDCFLQNPVIQALVDKPVRLATPTNINIIGSTPAEDTGTAAMDDAWLSAPLFPIIKLKHNNLQRLKQHIISVDLLHFSGVVYGQGIVTFQVFDLSEIDSLKVGSSRASFNRQRHSPPSQHGNEATSADVSVGSTLLPVSTTAQGTGSNRRISQMVIRPSSRRESKHPASMSEALARKPASIIGSSHNSSIHRPSMLNSETEQSRSRITSSQLEQFANVQCNASFMCDLASGTTSLGSLSGTMRLSWESISIT